MTKILLNDHTGIDLPTLIETRLAVLANSGGGKSWAIRRLIEQAFGKVQIIVIDPEGEYANLRKEYDFVLAGKDQDAPVELRSAGLLARRLLELEASAIIDLYDLVPQDRKHFVRLFLESVMNAPKELYHDVLFVIDEAHVFAPEGKPSEASGAMEALASQGRKRGFCAVFATQRIAKMSKDVLAECNNKMIGRMNLDVDRKRAAEELGFTTKDQVLSLRNLKPGEFHMFGPAISADVILERVGDVKVPPMKRGSKRVLKSPPPTTRVKKILGELADLPEAAKKEATTIAELKQELTTLKREREQERKHPLVQAVPDQAAIDQAVQKAIKETEDRKEAEFWEERTKWLEQIHNWFEILKGIGESMKEFEKVKSKITKRQPIGKIYGIPVVVEPKVERPYLDNGRQRVEISGPLMQIDKLEVKGIRDSIGAGERKVLQAIAQFQDGITREHLTVLTGYKRSSRDTYIQRLRAGGYIEVRGSYLVATNDGIETLGSDYKPLPTGPELQAHVLSTLPEGERKILQILIEAYPNVVEREYLTHATNYQRSSRDTYIQRLGARKLITQEGRGMVRASDMLF